MNEETMISILQVRQEQLLQIINRKRRSLRNSPEGSLRANRQRNAWRYFWKADKTDRYGKYLRKEERPQACRLAQKYYDQKVLECAKGELDRIAELENYLKTSGVEEAFENCPPSHQPLIRSLSEDEQREIAKWKNITYKGTYFRPGETPIRAKDGTRMHSKSEVMIADMIIDKGIPYHYEKPVYIKEIGKVHPDFTIYDINRKREIIWEHFGMMDVKKYVQKNIRKYYYYLESGYRLGDNLIVTMESADVHLTVQQVEQCLDAHLNVW